MGYMDKAVSIRFGGVILDASDSRLKSTGYWQFGLCCSSCGEAVYWKSGWVNNSHFAHFPKTSFSQECSLRLNSSSNSHTSTDSYSVNEKKLSLAGIYSDLASMLTAKQMNLVLQEDLKIDGIEQNVINLIQVNKVKNLGIFKELFKEHFLLKQSRIWYMAVSFDNDSVLERLVMKQPNFSIGQEVLRFISRPANLPILHGVVRFYRNSENLNDESSIQLLRRRAIESVVERDWETLLRN